MSKLSILDVKISNKNVLIRVDFNVSIHDGKILDDTRIRETIPTLKYLLGKNNTLIILSHLGRPKGQDEKYSLKPVCLRLQKYLNQEVLFINQFKKDPKSIIARLKKGSVVMLENIRFNPGEELNDKTYSKSLAKLGEVYVNDAFAVSHRAHASTVGITKFLPAFAGLLLIKEINVLVKVLTKPDRPVVSIIGGAKISDKIGLIKKQLDLAQTVIVGGGIANTFLKAKGITIGKSLVENEAVETARVLLYEAASKHSALLLPLDVIVKDSLSGSISQKPVHQVLDTDAIMDIGKEIIKLFEKHILNAGTIIFNGPVGKHEEAPFGK